MKLILQGLADRIYKRLSTCPKNKVTYWYNVGIRLNDFALIRGIELK